MRIKPTSKQGRALFELDRKDDQLLDETSTGGTKASAPFGLKSILVPIDFSDLSKKALHYALPVARNSSARIILLHVVEPKTHSERFLMTPPNTQNGNTRKLDECERKLLNLGQREIGPGIKCEAIVQTGKPYVEIVSIAKARGADLIIMATHGYTGLRHALAGSTAERVLRQAPCPVLVVRDKEREFVGHGEPPTWSAI